MPIILQHVTPPTNRIEATIQLLEAIGRDAWLYHATPEGLLQALIDAKASHGLQHAASTGDASQLRGELGSPVANHVINQTATDTSTTTTTTFTGSGG